MDVVDELILPLGLENLWGGGGGRLDLRLKFGEWVVRERGESDPDHDPDGDLNIVDKLVLAFCFEDLQGDGEGVDKGEGEGWVRRRGDGGRGERVRARVRGGGERGGV